MKKRGCLITVIFVFLFIDVTFPYPNMQHVYLMIRDLKKETKTFIQKTSKENDECYLCCDVYDDVYILYEKHNLSHIGFNDCHKAALKGLTGTEIIFNNNNNECDDEDDKQYIFIEIKKEEADHISNKFKTCSDSWWGMFRDVVLIWLYKNFHT